MQSCDAGANRIPKVVQGATSMLVRSSVWWVVGTWKCPSLQQPVGVAQKRGSLRYSSFDLVFFVISCPALRLDICHTACLVMSLLNADA